MTQDKNMVVALIWGHEFSGTARLPSRLRDVSRRLALVEEVNDLFKGGKDLVAYSPDQKAAFVEDVGQRATKHLTLRGPKRRAGISLRLWSGCLWAAKTIATETRSGQNDAPMRFQVCFELDLLSERDSVFRAGVETAVPF